jgi:hypothetical protein
MRMCCDIKTFLLYLMSRGSRCWIINYQVKMEVKRLIGEEVGRVKTEKAAFPND